MKKGMSRFMALLLLAGLSATVVEASNCNSCRKSCNSCRTSCKCKKNNCGCR